LKGPIQTFLDQLEAESAALRNAGRQASVDTHPPRYAEGVPMPDRFAGTSGSPDQWVAVPADHPAVKAALAVGVRPTQTDESIAEVGPGYVMIDRDTWTTLGGARDIGDGNPDSASSSQVDPLSSPPSAGSPFGTPQPEDELEAAFRALRPGQLFTDPEGNIRRNEPKADTGKPPAPGNSWRDAPIVAKASDIPSHMDPEGFIAWEFTKQYDTMGTNEVYQDPYGNRRLKRGSGFDWQFDPLYRDAQDYKSLGPAKEATRWISNRDRLAALTAEGADPAEIARLKSGNLAPGAGKYYIVGNEGVKAEEFAAKVAAQKAAEEKFDREEILGGPQSLRSFGKGMSQGQKRVGALLTRGVEAIGLVPEGTADTANETIDAREAALDQIAGGSESQRTLRGAGSSVMQNAIAAAVVGPLGAKLAAGGRIAQAAGAGVRYGGTPALFGATAANEAYTEARRKGLSDATAAKYAATSGIITGGVTLASQLLGKLVPGAGGSEEALLRRQIAETLTQRAVRAGVGTIAEVAEENIDALGQALAKKLHGVDPNALDAGKLADELWETTKATLLTMGVLKAPGAAVAIARTPGAQSANDIKAVGGARWAADNPAAAAQLATLENPSRTDVAKATGTHRNAWSNGPARDEFVADVKSSLRPPQAAPNAAETPTATQAQTATTNRQNPAAPVTALRAPSNATPTDERFANPAAARNVTEPSSSTNRNVAPTPASLAPTHNQRTPPNPPLDPSRDPSLSARSPQPPARPSTLQGQATPPPPTSPPATPPNPSPSPAPQFAEGGVVNLKNGSRLKFPPGAVAENGDIVLPPQNGQPARTIPAANVARLESPDGQTRWRPPPAQATSPQATPTTTAPFSENASGPTGQPAAPPSAESSFAAKQQALRAEVAEAKTHLQRLNNGKATQQARAAAKQRLTEALKKLRRLNGGLGLKEEAGGTTPAGTATEQSIGSENGNADERSDSENPTEDSISLGNGQYWVSPRQQLSVFDFGPNSQYQVRIYNNGGTIAIGDKSDRDLRNTSLWVKPQPDVVDVVIHGMPGAFVEAYDGALEIPASVIAELLEKQGIPRGTPLRLLTCYATEAPKAPGQSIAKQLFDIWGGPVQGPNGLLHAWPNGDIRIDLIDWGPGIGGGMEGTLIGTGQGQFLPAVP
jgi:hypothetical protein